MSKDKEQVTAGPSSKLPLEFMKDFKERGDMTIEEQTTAGDDFTLLLTATRQVAESRDAEQTDLGDIQYVVTADGGEPWACIILAAPQTELLLDRQTGSACMYSYELRHAGVYRSLVFDMDNAAKLSQAPTSEQKLLAAIMDETVEYSAVLWSEQTDGYAGRDEVHRLGEFLSGK